MNDVASHFLSHAQHFSSSICFEHVWVDSVASAEEDPTHRPQLSLSYGDAIECYHQHVQHLYMGCPNMISATVNPPLPTPTWVIAYLSHNNIDYMLSTLAACSGKAGNQSDMPHLLPVLLPTKWTVSEIVQVLQLPRDDTVGAVTILLYDALLQPLAQQVQQKLVLDTNCHAVFCLPLPTYAYDWMFQRNRQKSRNFRLSPFSERLVPWNATTDAVVHDVGQSSTEDAVILFTSGTTSGHPLGVRLSHRAIYVQACAKQSLFRPSTRLFCHTVPFYHVGGLTNYFAVWLSGGTLVQPLHHQSKRSPMASLSFDPQSIFQCWNGSDDNTTLPNALVVVPAMLSMMQQYYNDHKEMTSHIFPHIRCILIGGQSAPRDVLCFLRRVFPKAQLIQTYACTEAASSLTFDNVTLDPGSAESSSLSLTPPVDVDTVNAATSLDDFSSYNPKMDPEWLTSLGQCVGRPPAHVELFLWKEHWEMEHRAPAPADGATLPWFIHTPFTPGIIVTRGPHVMNGYWSERGRPRPMSPSDRLLQRTGYFVTNDIGFWDAQGTLFYLGRRTDTIRTGGETVWCTEVEQVIQVHPQVVECAVFGIPDARFGEAVCGSVVVGCNPSTRSLELEEIRSWCRSNGLAGYKCPRHLLIGTTALPRNTNGKVLKFQLQNQLRRCLSNEAATNETGMRVLSKL